MGEQKVQTHNITVISLKMMRLHDNEFSLAAAHKNRWVGPQMCHFVYYV